jgi:hypothetical protein
MSLLESIPQILKGFFWLWEGFVLLSRAVGREIREGNPLWTLMTIGNVIQHWKVALAFLLLCALLCSPYIFSRWKLHHLRSYAITEIAAATCAILLLLPWGQNILDISSYSSLLDITKIMALLGAIYFGVRGVENLNKAKAAK